MGNRTNINSWIRDYQALQKDLGEAHQLLLRVTVIEVRAQEAKKYYEFELNNYRKFSSDAVQQRSYGSSFGIWSPISCGLGRENSCIKNAKELEGKAAEAKKKSEEHEKKFEELTSEIAVIHRELEQLNKKIETENAKLKIHKVE